MVLNLLLILRRLVRELVLNLLLSGLDGLPLLLRRNPRLMGIPSPLTGIGRPGGLTGRVIPGGSQGDGSTGVGELSISGGHLNTVDTTGGVIGGEGFDIGLAIGLPVGNLGGVRAGPFPGEDVKNVGSGQFRRLRSNGLDGVLGGPKGIHLRANSSLSGLKMNGIVGSGLNKGKGGISSSLPSTALPTRQSLGPKGTNPLSAFNHPTGQIPGTDLSIRQRVSAFATGDLFVDLRCSQGAFGCHQLPPFSVARTFEPTV
ncbi:hypothetical protein [Amycolatopsis sp. NPDC098790]|uniref:hypothetical protein n=1 Tax=Amycolatopsis sp. NPDC098790 TaxID=3363939 RepID=UPI0038075A4D